MTHAPLPALVDIGANLTHDSFDADRDAVLERARAHSVTRFVVTGSDALHSRRALALCSDYPGLYATAGVHPHHAKDCTPATPGELRELLGDPRVVAAGECGLDYFRNFSPPEVQREVFAMQLALAVESGKPIFLHQRDAHEDFLRILKQQRPRLSRAVVHCFTGGPAELEDYLALDCYIGVTGWVCDERRGELLRSCIKRIPAERLMIETDAPYLLPRDLRPKPASHRNEPMHLAHICRVVAELRGVDAVELAHATTANAERFFALAASTG